MRRHKASDQLPRDALKRPVAPDQLPHGAMGRHVASDQLPRGTLRARVAAERLYSEDQLHEMFLSEQTCSLRYFGS